MSEGYPRVPLCELADLRMGGTPSRVESRYWAEGQSGHPWVSIADLNDKFIDTTRETITDSGAHAARLRPVPPDVPIMSFKLTIGKCAIPRLRVFTNEAIVALVALEGRSVSRWLYHVVPGIAGQQISATAVKGQTLNLPKLRHLLVPTPAIGEQRQIADILDDLDDQIGATRRIVAKLRVAEGGLLHSLMQTVEDIATMGERGHWCRVDNAGSVTLGRQRSPLRDANAHRMPYLRVANVLDGHINYSDVLSMSFSAAESLVYELCPGDILLNEGQSIDLVGRCAIYDGPPGMCFQNTLVRFRSVSQVLPRYARLVFKHWLVTGVFAQVAKRTTSIAHLGADRFAQMSFPLISRSEQVRLVSAVATFEDRLHAQLKAQDKLGMLKKGLMEDLLMGKVRVTRSGELTG